MHYDYVIVGAGSAGCIVASRLTEDPKIKVLVIEAGGSDRSLIISMPAALPFAYQSKKLGWGYQSGPEPNLGGRTIDEKRGRVVGGSSSINAMLFNRGNPLDFDSWPKTVSSTGTTRIAFPIFAEWKPSMAARMLGAGRRADENQPLQGLPQASRGVPSKRRAGWIFYHRRPQWLPPGRPACRPGVHQQWFALDARPRLSASGA